MRAVAALAACAVRELVRKKDFYVLFIFMLVLLGLLASQTFFRIEGVTRYVRDFGYTIVMFFSFVVAVTTAARQIPLEVESRTIYPLLAKPVSRIAVILGKYAGSLAASAISFTVFYAVFAAFYLSAGSEVNALLLGQGFLLGILFLCFVCAIVIFLSNILTLSANVTITFIMYLSISGFSDAVKEAAMFSDRIVSYIFGTLFYVIPHLEFYDMRVRLTHSWDPLPAWVICAVALYTVAYASLLLCFAGALFKGKKL